MKKKITNFKKPKDIEKTMQRNIPSPVTRNKRDNTVVPIDCNYQSR